jgi:hypothetical protein
MKKMRLGATDLVVSTCGFGRQETRNISKRQKTK